METECKRILLLKGLQPLNDDQFSMVKSLLDSDLGLTSKMKEDYTKVKIADMMHKKFRGILCVNKLLMLLKDIEGLEDTVKTIKNEKRKVMKKYKTQGLAPVKKRKQEASSTDESTSTANKASRPLDDTLVSKKRKTKTTGTNKSNKTQPTSEWGQLGQPAVTGALSPASFSQPPQMPPPTPGCSFSTKKPRLKSVPTKASREEGLQKCAKEVMVLKATEPFAYDITDEERKMFHATVVTESQFFRVKVFHVGLKDKFIPKRVITLADYIGRNGFLEVYNVSSVSDVSADRKMEVSSRLIQNANATPKIKELRSEEPGTFVSGVYQVHKKMVLDQCITLYEIQDDTGTMDVLVYGRLTKVNCEEGDKLTLICFELSGDPRQLRSVTHSFIKTHTLLPPVFPVRTIPSTLGIEYTCPSSLSCPSTCTHAVGHQAQEKQETTTQP
ncbi:interferon-activable protein 203-like isoform X3 [Herpailurus yagouaroundi]|uniref:interferon-activable protein 203-like isoform X3 n=1 Tax=Herpailurus yagouaroundi TaxID=1608482 RepID=UPI001AD6FC0A|nr:interferon-activable protein 203-like isoform X3 [Puma yagouaroundi]